MPLYTNGLVISNMTVTWNNAGTVFTAVKMNVTNTASSALSKLMDLQIGGVSLFSVNRQGAITTPHADIGNYIAILNDNNGVYFGVNFDVAVQRKAAQVLTITDGDVGPGMIQTPAFTVATLVAAATAGAGTRSFVSDALGPLFGAAVVGGGAVKIPVYSDGVTWLVG